MLPLCLVVFGDEVVGNYSCRTGSDEEESIGCETETLTFFLEDNTLAEVFLCEKPEDNGEEDASDSRDNDGPQELCKLESTYGTSTARECSEEGTLCELCRGEQTEPVDIEGVEVTPYCCFTEEEEEPEQPEDP